MENKMSQEERIKKFYEIFLSQNPDVFLTDFVSYLLLGIGMIATFVPVQELISEKDALPVLWIILIWIGFAANLYMSKYYTYTNAKIPETVPDQLLYMPIDKKVYKKFLFSQLLRFLKKVTIAGLVIQTGMTLLIEHTISIWNFVYVLTLTFVLPFLLCGITIVTRKSTR